MTIDGSQLNDNGYKRFSKKQIFSLQKLLNILAKKYKIEKKYILGHSDISPGRKKDPGEKFPWEILAKNKLSFWHNLDQKKIKKFREKKLTNKIDKNLFLNNLYKIGYNRVKKFKSHKTIANYTR